MDVEGKPKEKKTDHEQLIWKKEKNEDWRKNTCELKVKSQEKKNQKTF